MLLPRTGCEGCRVRHYKCDGQRPACSRCVRARRQCVRLSSLRYRTARDRSIPENFPSGQTWLPMPSQVNFVERNEGIGLEVSENETSLSKPTLGSGAYSPKSFSDTFDTLREIPTSSGIVLSPSSTSDMLQLHSEQCSPNGSAIQSNLSIVVRDGVIPLSLLSPKAARANRNSTGLSQIYTNPPIWPLTDPEEATLLRHFVDNISGFFDFCDRDKHFATVAPQRARKCRILLSAIMALSARHLSRTTDFNPLVADHYYQECLSSLIIALDDSTAIMDELLLTTIVILRLLEEMDVSIVGSDTMRHSIGSQSVLRAQEEIPMDSGLRRAAYWSCLRQEIFIALSNQRPLRLSLQPYNLNHSFEQVDDWTWASRATLHCAESLQFCFGDESRSVHKELVEYNKKWHQFRPASFDPYFYSEDSASNPGFPDIRLGLDCHVMGIQYLLLAHILLVAYDPAIPRVGLARQQALHLAEEKTRMDVRVLCGVALSNPGTPPAFLIACMSITLCGYNFSARKEQERLHEILVHTEKLHGWPTQSAQDQLSSAWGWSNAK